MQYISHKSNYIESPVVLCLGTFDGLHLAHQQLLVKGKALADLNQWKTAVYSFENIPAGYLSHKNEKINLFTHDEKVNAFNEKKIDYLWLDFFDEHIAGIAPREFVQYITSVINVKHMVIGFDFTFGKQALGHPDDLRKFGQAYGFDVTVIDPVMLNGQTISSSLIRNCLCNGEIEKANEMLGYDYAVSGTVIHGKNNGEKLGYPTINLSVESKKLLPKIGVYATETIIGNERYPSITNIGIRPTLFDDGELTVETYILDINMDLYGEFISVRFLKFISDEIKLDVLNDLKDKIAEDVRKVREFFEKRR